MTIQRIKNFPYPKEFKSVGDAHTWAKSLYRALHENETAKLNDWWNFSQLLGGNPINVYNYGTTTPVNLTATIMREGAVFTNADASGTITFNLPPAEIGMHATFLVSVTQEIIVNPDDADLISVMTDIDGNHVNSSDVVGAYLSLVCQSPGTWYPVGYLGIWACENGTVYQKAFADPWIDVREFGAKGDGSTDDTAAIKQAIDSISSTGGGILFPIGTYIVNPYENTVSSGYYAGIWVPGHITLMGSGVDSTTIKLGPNQPSSRDGLKVYMIANKNIAATYLDQHVKVCDLTIDGNNTNQGSCHSNNGLGFMRLRGGIAENVKIKNILGQNNTGGAGSYDGMAFQGWLSTDLSFINCIAHRDAGEMSSGFQAVGCSNVKYANCWAINMSCTGDGGVGFCNYNCGQAQYTNCHSFLNKKTGFANEYSEWVSHNGSIAGGQSSPLSATPNGIGTAYAADTSFGNTDAGFTILECDHIQIVGGSASNATRGIWINGTANHVIVSGTSLDENTNPIVFTTVPVDMTIQGISPELVNYGASTPITVKQTECYGSTLTNTNAGASIHFDLPAAVAGMNITFYNTVNKAIVIDPYGTNQIMVVTDTAGDTLTSDGVIGSYIHLESLAANKWYVRDYKGTWTEE